MKSFTAILFAAVAALALTSAVPVPEGTLTNQNPLCKQGVDTKRKECFNDKTKDLQTCQTAYNDANIACDKKYPTSSAAPPPGAN
ncbi:hypothetical protein BGX23_003075 [Mortierella sp. AD031]|nr:hypothetical protein BGX23_003075 [Mortierella sp. AD031]